MLSNEQKVQECDARDDASSNAARYITLKSPLRWNV